MDPQTELQIQIPRPSNGQPAQVAHITDVLIQMQRLGSTHFVRALPKTPFRNPSVRRPAERAAELTLPTEFVQANDEKIEEWVTLRTRLSSGKSSRPWLVRLHFKVERLGAVTVKFVDGWSLFVADNRLHEGDYLVFLLKEDARSEFEVCMFRGPWGTAYFPDQKENSNSAEENISDSEEGEAANDSDYSPKEGENSDPEEAEEEEEEEESSDPEEEGEEEGNFNNQRRGLHSPVHQEEEEEPNHIFTREYMRELNPAPLHHSGNPHAHPGFSKRLVAYNIGRTGAVPYSAQFEFPSGFLRTHGEQVRDSVTLQGVHDNSPEYVITCRRRTDNYFKVYCNTAQWSGFVHDNGLKEGDKLQFTLVADSHFVVRKIS